MSTLKTTSKKAVAKSSKKTAKRLSGSNTSSSSVSKQNDPIGTGTVTASSLNVRKGPGANYDRIGGLTKGKTIQVYADEGDWIKIAYGSSYGYVAQKYTTYKDAQTQPPVTQPETPSQKTGTVTTSSGSLNIRAGASKDYDKVGSAPKGATVNILGQSNGWYQIEYNGVTGWVDGSFITVNQSGTEQPEQPQQPEQPTTGILSDSEAQNAADWNNKQGYSTAIIKEIQKLVGTAQTGSFSAADSQAIAAWQKSKGLEADGKFGSKSMSESDIKIPEESFKTPNQSDVRKNTSIFGKMTDLSQSSMQTVSLPYPMYSSTSRTTKKTVKVHPKIVGRVQNIFQDALSHYGIEGIKKNHLDIYSGCYNQRKVNTGGESNSGNWSIHSWGIAIDLDASNNPYTPTGNDPLSKESVVPFWKIVEKHGARSLGRDLKKDWMHFQFAYYK